MKKKIVFKIINYSLLISFVFFGHFFIRKFVEIKNLVIDDAFWWDSIFLSSCLWAYFGNRYCKVVKQYPYNKKTIAAITVGFFLFGALFTYFGANVIAMGLTILFEHLFKIDTYLPKFVPVFSATVGIVSSVIAIIAYQIAVEKNMTQNSK